MNIGEAATVSGVNAKLIRHYESIGIIPKARRSDAGYRKYSQGDIQALSFIRRARSLGFSMKEIKKLLGLWQNRSRTSSEVKRLALLHIKGLEEKIEELEAMRGTLMNLVAKCHGDERSDCPILDDLSKLSQLT